MSLSSPSATQQSSLPLAHPAYILRGHTSPIHVLTFFSNNRYLVSGDADGWLVVWSTTSKRTSAVWKAHEGSVMGLKEWKVEKKEGVGRVVSHGRDHKLRVWQLREEDFETLDKCLPAEGAEEISQGPQRSDPWLLFALDVNALNFCVFGMCYNDIDLYTIHNGHSSGDSARAHEATEHMKTPTVTDITTSTSFTPILAPKPKAKYILLAAANALTSGAIDIFHLPSSRRVSTIPTPEPTIKTGMLMAVDIAFIHHDLNPSFQGSENVAAIPPAQLTVAAGYESGHVCVHIHQHLSHSSSINGTDSGKGRQWRWQTVYSSQPHTQPVLSLAMSPLAHEWFISSAADAIVAKHPLLFPWHLQQHHQNQRLDSRPLKTINTKHAGQQGVAIRDDGKVVATAGWDKKVRVYGAKGMREVAVLKWHREGCYAVAWADVLPTNRGDTEGIRVDTEENETTGKDGDEETSALARIREARAQKAQNIHWLAAGGKDGKISLWEIY